MEKSKRMRRKSEKNIKEKSDDIENKPKNQVKIEKRHTGNKI